MNTTSATDRVTVSHLVDFWPRFLLFPILAIAFYPPFILGWGGDGWLVKSVWVAFLTFSWFCVAGSFHESVHHTLFKQASQNVAVGRFLGILIGIPYSVYRETHRRHHACLNTQGDYELWPYSDPRTSLAFRRAFVWIDLLGGVVTAPYIYGRIYFLRDPRLSPEVRRTIFWEYVSIVFAWLAFVIAILVWTNRIGFNWRQFDPVWLLPLILSPMVNTGRKFVEHLGMESVDPILGTRTVMAGNPLTRITSYFNFDIAVHGPHHRYPKSSHNELTPRMRAYQQDHQELAIPLFGSYLSAMIDMVPCLWCRPSTGSALTSKAMNGELPESFDWEEETKEEKQRCQGETMVVRTKVSWSEQRCHGQNKGVRNRKRVRLMQILSPIGSASVVSRGYDSFVRPASLCGETGDAVISTSARSVNLQRKQWFLTRTALSPRGGTGWLALEPTGVPWHKKFVVINLSIQEPLSAAPPR